MKPRRKGLRNLNEMSALIVGKSFFLFFSFLFFFFFFFFFFKYFHGLRSMRGLDPRGRVFTNVARVRFPDSAS